MSAIILVVPEGNARRWHKRLFDGLVADGHRVAIAPRAAPDESPSALAMVERLEKLLFVRGRAGACDPAPLPEQSASFEGAADLVFDLTGAAEPAPGAVAMLYDGAAGDLARDAALLEGRAPRLALARASGDGWILLAQALPAVERPWLVTSGRDAVANRTVTLLRAFATGRASDAEQLSQRRAPRLPAPLAHMAGAVAHVARSKLRRLLAHEGHWRIGMRSLGDGDSAIASLAWPPDGPWRWLADDRRRYFADPFLFEEAGTTYVFCEEYPYATQKGIISVFALDANGVAGTPRAVLERPYHLSYPLVFRHDGEIWMMPESSANRTLELYRAETFPTRWVLDRVLIAGEELSDATPFEHGGRWWLTAASNEPGTSSWDCLSLFSGPGPLGPWRRSGDGPVLIDASAARPAGLVVRRDGALWRPAQDCSAGYGSGLALCRIDELGDGLLRQSVMRRLKPPRGAPAMGVHTLNDNGRFEVIDAVGSAGRFGAFGDGDPA